MKTVTALAATAALATTVLGAPAASSALTNTITLSNGVIEGNPRDANGILNFKGIPYAQPPVGNLRWHSPQQPGNWAETLNTTAFGASCYSSTIPAVPYIVPPSESCLFVNIWTGAQQANEKRPVMVWIHGGGFQFSSASQGTFDGTQLAKDGVIIVSFNYRLGVFGFLALSDLDQEGSNSGNFGLQDAQQALKWVKNNIAAFGGDPNNVTLFGESAGAHAVGLLMTSTLSKGLFNKAILESGAFWDSAAGPLGTFAQARAQGAAFQQKVGASSLAALRAMSATAINSAVVWPQNIDPKFAAFSPTLDNYVIADNPGTVFNTARQLQIPLLAGWNGNEGSIFQSYGIPYSSAAQFERGAELYFGAEVPSPFTRLYPDGTPAQLNASALDLTGDMVIREQIYYAVEAQHRNPLLFNSVYVYEFNYTSAYSPSPIHTSEIPFVFGNLLPSSRFPVQGPPTSADQAFSTTLRTYWTNFAKKSNPNGAGVPSWSAYRGSGANAQLLANTIQTINYKASRYAFIRSFRKNGVLPESWRSINVSAIS